MNSLITVLLVVAVFLLRDCDAVHRKFLPRHDEHEVGEQLLLSEFILNGRVDEARKLARVNGTHFLDVLSYAGFLTVNQTHNSNLFFWFFPAMGTESLYEEECNHNVTEEIQIEQKPLMLWLEGGPGRSSMYGALGGQGAFTVDPNLLQLRKNPYSWHTNFSMLYIDNPAGVGFSFTDDTGYSANISQVTDELYSAMSQFFQLFPKLRVADFYISGQSYAGKYVPALGNRIHEQNKVQIPKIRLKGLTMGNAVSDTYYQMNVADIAHQMGLIDYHVYESIKVKVNSAMETWNSNRSSSSMMFEDALHILTQNSEYESLLNVLKPTVDKDLSPKFLRQNHIRKALNVGPQTYNEESSIVFFKLIPEIYSDIQDIRWSEKLLDAGYKVMYYNGNLDFLIPFASSEMVYRNMMWCGAELYNQTKRKTFRIDGTLHGYTKKANNFVEVVVLNAGHSVPKDQPKATLELMVRFVYDLIL